MLTHEGNDRDFSADASLAGSLAAVAGALNAAGFYAADLYCSNMTGNVSAMASRLAVADPVQAFGYFALLVTFILGAAASAFLINYGRRRGVIGIYAFSVLAESALLALLAAISLCLGEQGRAFCLAYGLSFLMGLQNATVTRISDARIRTTHVTGMVTDVGMELGNLADSLWHRRNLDQSKENAADRQKLKLHSFTIGCFIAGGIAGATAFRVMGPAFLFVGSVALLVLALIGIFARR
jgi:uncharacterized membrane protein YoaK (UPF0700 family)